MQHKHEKNSLNQFFAILAKNNVSSQMLHNLIVCLLYFKQAGLLLTTLAKKLLNILVLAATAYQKTAALARMLSSIDCARLWDPFHTYACLTSGFANTVIDWSM